MSLFFAALAEAVDALKQFPKDPELHALRANALATLSRHAEAEQAYKELLDLVHGRSDVPHRYEQQALTWLGVSTRRQGRNKDAIKWLERADAFHPTRESLHHLAISRAMEADFAGAARDTARAMSLSVVDEGSVCVVFLYVCF